MTIKASQDPEFPTSTQLIEGAKAPIDLVRFGPVDNMQDAYDVATGGIKTKVVGGVTTSVDNSTYTTGLDAGLPAFAFADEVSPAFVDEGKVGVLRMSRERILLARPGIPARALWSRVIVNESTIGDRTIVAAVASQTTKLMGFRLSVAGAVNLRWGFSGTPTYFEAVWIGTGNGATYSFWSNGEPFGETAINTALILNLSAAVAVTGVAWYLTSVPPV